MMKTAGELETEACRNSSTVSVRKLLLCNKHCEY